eukprot:TRINITY_DN35611_c0_g1_i1.p1 TRINITY_DN35611_c0_g1~~TRINITY_DN35611_c0_g1_i1.p1  ORF type:complete len:809 (+),score=298.19 TRINITY_DN35611_c0_g1_i1:59-2485(+)
MRIFIKGGTWKNHEDEILKAAVMKYGKNQWARIASLLPKKSAKQCKARWYEWLDPSIKKTEWTREEEEKLLHLAKIMPCQWLTIAPIVGRTPHQCLEHYEKLLDQAQERGEDYDPADDPRKLRPGEIDPHPEVKPPRPDALDMDDDEKEMLNEARARLANTKGKKAKRKAREKQLDHARRLATLQKRRELRAAGIDMPGSVGGARSRSRRGLKGSIDYASDIPFWQEAPAGFFDTTEERQRIPERPKELDPQKKELANRDDKEKAARREDKIKQVKRRLENLPEHFERVNRLNDPSGGVRRSELVMPAPQVTDVELEKLQKLGPETLSQLQQERRTLGERTPATIDTVATMARDQAMLQNLQTPLAGGETPVTSDQYRDFKGVTPMRVEHATPNLMKSQATPRTDAGQAAFGGAGATPVRDALRINERGDMTPSMTPSAVYHAGASRGQKQHKLQERLQQAELDRDLKGLPQPKDEVEIQPQLTDEQMAVVEAAPSVPTDDLRPDRADVEQARKRRRIERKEAEHARQTQAVQRGLPRPVSAAVEAQAAEPVQQMLERELLLLVAHDAHAHPTGKRPGPKPRTALDGFSAKQLAAAADLLRREEETLKEQSPLFGHLGTHAGSALELCNPAKVAEELRLCSDDLLFVPNPARVLHKRQCTPADRLEAAKHQFETARRQLAAKGERASALEGKVGVLTAGYTRRMHALQNDLEHTWAEEGKLATTLESFQQLRCIEQIAIQSRKRRLEEEVSVMKERESRLQSEYANLRRECAELAEHQLKVAAEEADRVASAKESAAGSGDTEMEIVN